MTEGAIADCTYRLTVDEDGSTVHERAGGPGGRGMRESQSPDEQLICVRLCKVVQSFWILRSIHSVSQNESIPLSVSGICHKGKTNLLTIYNAYTKTCYHP